MGRVERILENSGIGAIQLQVIDINLKLNKTRICLQ